MPAVRSSTSTYLRAVETLISSDDVSTSPQTFDLLGGTAGRSLLVDYFYFVDVTGAPVDPTGGTVTITFSAGPRQNETQDDPTLPDLFVSVDNGTFPALDARNVTRDKPGGYGKAVRMQVELTGITGAATGFRALISQSAR